MTREEAIRIFRKEIECLSHAKCEDCILEKVCDPAKTTPLDSEYIEAYGMAIKALSQEHKLGKWITLENRFDLGDRVKCSECGQVFVVGDSVSRKYCPNCGAKMVEPQESEEISERNMKMWEEIFKAERR